MKKFDIDLTFHFTLYDIEAETKSEAIEKAREQLEREFGNGQTEFPTRGRAKVFNEKEIA